MSTATLERRLRALEAGAEPPKGRKIRTLLDLIIWTKDENAEEMDLSECPEALVKVIYDACCGADK